MSASTVRITAPSGAFSPTFRAAAKLPPDEMPQKMPPLLASAREAAIASSSVTVTISCGTERLSTCGTEPDVDHPVDGGAQP